MGDTQITFTVQINTSNWAALILGTSDPTEVGADALAFIGSNGVSAEDWFVTGSGNFDSDDF